MLDGAHEQYNGKNDQDADDDIGNESDIQIFLAKP